MKTGDLPLLNLTLTFKEASYLGAHLALAGAVVMAHATDDLREREKMLRIAMEQAQSKMFLMGNDFIMATLDRLKGFTDTYKP